ncbi:MAG: hypothetical protein HY238_18820 [Acidobacteria bacterium]|nr:hypothetical protein [Acidobacteriota bacterium]
MKKANKVTPQAPMCYCAGVGPRLSAPMCYCAGVGPRLSALLDGAMLNAPGFDHFRSAGVEVLMGLRAILDAQIEAIQKKSRKGTRVPVE